MSVDIINNFNIEINNGLLSDVGIVPEQDNKIVEVLFKPKEATTLDLLSKKDGLNKAFVVSIDKGLPLEIGVYSLLNGKKTIEMSISIHKAHGNIFKEQIDNLYEIIMVQNVFGQLEHVNQHLPITLNHKTNSFGIIRQNEGLSYIVNGIKTQMSYIKEYAEGKELVFFVKSKKPIVAAYYGTPQQEISRPVVKPNYFIKDINE